jgi:hypothetical protein
MNVIQSCRFVARGVAQFPGANYSKAIFPNRAQLCSTGGEAVNSLRSIAYSNARRVSQRQSVLRTNIYQGSHQKEMSSAWIWDL